MSISWRFTAYTFFFTPDMYGLHVYLGVSRSPAGGDKRAEETAGGGAGEGPCNCKPEGKKEAVIKEKERHVFIRALRILWRGVMYFQ